MGEVDRIQFAHSIDTGNIDYETAFVNYFDQLMGVYGHIQPCDYKTTIVDSGENYLVLEISVKSKKRMTEVLSILNKTDTISVYERIFKYQLFPESESSVQLRIVTEV